MCGAEELAAPRCGINTKLLPPQRAVPLAVGSRLTGFQRRQRQTARRKLGANVGARPGSGDNDDPRHNSFAPGLTSPRGSPPPPDPYCSRAERPSPAGSGGGGNRREQRLFNPLPGEEASSESWPSRGSTGELKRLRRGAERALAVMCIGAGGGK